MYLFQKQKKYFNKKYHDKIAETGNPVRKSFFSGKAEDGRKFLGINNSLPVILVLGGSQGAAEINNLIRLILGKISDKYIIIHQCGEADYKADFGTEYENYFQVPFFKNEFPDILASADLIVSRGGAGTIWELSAAGKASIIIPLRGSGTRGDQLMNCRYLRSINAASVIDDKIITDDMLIEKIDLLFNNSLKLDELRKNIKIITKTDPADQIAGIIIKYAGGKK